MLQNIHSNENYCTGCYSLRCTIPSLFPKVQQFQACVPRIRSNQFALIWSEKIFPFQLYTTYPQEKSNHKKKSQEIIQNILLAYWRNALPRASVREWRSIGLWNIWLRFMFNISKNLSTINDYFKNPACFIDKHYF